MGTPTPDERAGMDWWNTLPDHEKTQWMRQAGDSGRVADAWAAFSQAELSRLGEALRAARREAPPDDPKNWVSILDDETRRPYWLPRNLNDQWHRQRLAVALRLKMRRGIIGTA